MTHLEIIGSLAISFGGGWAIGMVIRATIRLWWRNYKDGVYLLQYVKWRAQAKGETYRDQIPRIRFLMRARGSKEEK